MASDIVLTDNAIELVDAEHVRLERNGRSIEIDLHPNTQMQIGTDEHRGVVTIRGAGAALIVSRGRVQADDLVAKDEVRVGARSSVGTSPGRLTVQGANGVLLNVDGTTGDIEIEGVGNLAQRMAELAQLRSQVTQMERRLRAVENGTA